MDIMLAKKRYSEQKRRAKVRGIDFLLTFEEWANIWQQSGKWDQRGRGNGKYVMSRNGDIGPYAVGNVRIVIHRDNVAEMLHRRNSDPANGKKISDALKGKPKTLEHRMNLSKVNIGKKVIFTEQHKQNLRKPKPKLVCPHCNKSGGASVMKRWHFDRCKAIAYNK